MLPCGHLKGKGRLSVVCNVYCDYVTFSFGILGKVWYLIVSIPDPCCPPYFVTAGEFYLVTHFIFTSAII